MVARKGGDEFAVIFDGSEEDARHKMEGLRKEFTKEGYITEQSDILPELSQQKVYLSFSYGAHKIDPKKDKDFDAAFVEADQDCYIEKESNKTARRQVWESENPDHFDFNSHTAKLAREKIKDMKIKNQPNTQQAFH